MKPKKCECGGTPEVMAGDATKGYPIFVRCPGCEKEGFYVHPQLPIGLTEMLDFMKGYGKKRAIAEWNQGNYHNVVKENIGSAARL